MTNVKTQMPNECQMTKHKTNNHVTTRRRLPPMGGQLWRGRPNFKIAKKKAPEYLLLISDVFSPLAVHHSPFTSFFGHWDFGFYLTFGFCNLSFSPLFSQNH
jgi:hypothetical protein